MQHIAQIMDNFDFITLPEMEAEMLMRRFDYKFKFPIGNLPDILKNVSRDYKVLDINNIRLHKYESLYFDTDDFLLYTQHHRILRKRYKIRFRRYADSGITFFEIKTKTNKEFIIKERIKQKFIDPVLNDETGGFIFDKTNMNQDIFTPKLWVYYSRMTLVNRKDEERITIDLNPVMKIEGRNQTVAFPSLVIGEVKQRKYFRSPFVAEMRKNHIPKVSISKYCVGISCLQEGVKKNRFNYNLSTLNNNYHE